MDEVDAIVSREEHFKFSVFHSLQSFFRIRSYKLSSESYLTFKRELYHEGHILCNVCTTVFQKTHSFHFDLAEEKIGLEDKLFFGF